MNEPNCTCPHDPRFNTARDVQCPVHGTPAVVTVTDGTRPLHECPHTLVDADTLRCCRCGEPTTL